MSTAKNRQHRLFNDLVLPNDGAMDLGAHMINRTADLAHRGNLIGPSGGKGGDTWRSSRTLRRSGVSARIGSVSVRVV